ALKHLQESMQDWIVQHPQNIEVKNLQLILANLLSVHEQLQHLHDQQALYKPRYQQHFDDLSLFDDDIRDSTDLWLK
ncbi:TIGR01666 family membrane protein, partial [Yersinia pestis]